MAACSLSHVHVSLCLLVLVPSSNSAIIPALVSLPLDVCPAWCRHVRLGLLLTTLLIPPTDNKPGSRELMTCQALVSWQFHWQICSIALVIVYLPPWCLVEHPASHQVVTSAISHHLLTGTLLCSLVCLLSDICAGALYAVLLTY